MPKRYIPQFSEVTLQVSGRCNLSCILCPLWQLPEPPKYNLNDIRKNSLQAHSYNIIGGEPSLNIHLLKIVQHLKSDNRFVRLWTNGQLSLDYWSHVVPFIDEVVLFLPTPDPELYREFTSEDSLHTLISHIDYLTSEKKNVILSVPVTPDMIDLLPDLHELAKKTSTTLLLHYNPREKFTKDHIDLIKRYHWIKNVLVFTDPFHSAEHCLGYAHPFTSDTFQKIRNWLQEIITHTYAKLDQL